MPTGIYERKGFKEGARVSGERPTGAASCRRQYNQASCQTTFSVMPNPDSEERSESFVPNPLFTCAPVGEVTLPVDIPGPSSRRWGGLLHCLQGDAPGQWRGPLPSSDLAFGW